jgi:hypothetical protein
LLFLLVLLIRQVHVDGAGCSSALERLLPLGGVVLREESGYFTYFQQVRV